MLILEKILAEETNHPWMPQETAPAGARIICPELNLAIAFHSERLVVDCNPIGDRFCDFDAIAVTTLATITGRFDLRDWRRFGSRHVDVLGTDSIDEAEALSLKYAPSSDWRVPGSDESGFTARQYSSTYIFELPDRSKGASVRTGPFHRMWAPAQLDERLKSPPHLLPKGQREALLDQLKRAKQREQSPEAGFVIDVDYYWVWPPQEAKVKDFLREAKQEASRFQAAVLSTRR